MKRRRDSILNQPTVKKPDVNTSTDLRSKIGAKLQTLLLANRVETLKRRQAVLLREPQHHSEIIIDPAIVVKTEAPEIEECNEISAVIDSPNFLSSAKSRITELLNKQQCGNNKCKNSEKENSDSSSECHTLSPVNSITSSSDPLQNQSSCSFQSNSCISVNKRRKVSKNKNSSDASSDVLSTVHLKNMVVVVEDVMKNRTRRSHSLSNKSVSEAISSSSESYSKNKKFSICKQRKNKAAKDVANKVSNSSAACDIDLCTIDDDSTTLSQSCRNLNSSDSVNLNNNNCELNSSKSKSSHNSKSSTSNSLNNCGLLLDVVDLGEILIAPEESSNLHFNHTEDDSELIDDPGSHNKVIDGNSSVSSRSEILNNESHDPDVVLLCVKRPTHEVITLEDVDDSDDIIEEVHRCTQCGKAFRAKSLLNFHIRMHGSDTSSSSKSSSIR